MLNIVSKVIKNGVCISILLAAAVHAQANVKLSIDVGQPGSKINKNIYGQFVEHLGRGVYDGFWVGENSKIPNTRGFRDDVIKALKALHVPLVRWPGGCFADEYHWRDGVGPKAGRPVTVNNSWGGVMDNNSFGTHEFFELAEILGAEVYVNGNLGTGSPREMAEWLEYMTSPSKSSLANLRRQNGREKPWKVDYFAVGNESWGCGGNMSPEYYSGLYKQYVTFLKTPEDNRPVFIASGGYDKQTIWSETLLKNNPESWSTKKQAISHHYYTLPTGKWDIKGKAVGFAEKEWLSTIVNTLKIEQFIQSNIEVMDKYDPQKNWDFFVDEWGTWYDEDKSGTPGILFQQNTLRDAVVAALNLNIFHKYSERVQMTNIAQMVNVLQAMILTDKEKMLLTPTYHVYKMYIPFQDSTSLPVELSDNPWYHISGLTAPQVSASAAVTSAGETVLALTNIHPHKSSIVSLGDAWKSAKGLVLTGGEMDSHNTFDNNRLIEPKKFTAKKRKRELLIELPAKSVVVVKLK